MSADNEHGVLGAAYQNTGVGLLPTLFCECGEHFQGETWEEAGAVYDEHLALFGREE